MDHDGGPAGDAAPSRRRATGVLAVGTSAIAWWPAFTLGAWGIVFFEQLMLLWAVSTAAFVVLVVAGTTREPISRWRVAALLVPTGWLVLALLTRTGEDSFLGTVAQLIGTVLTIVGIPAMAVLLLQVASPAALDVRDRRDRLAAGLAVLVVVVLSYGAGVWNARFLTCDDFVVSGNSAPPECNPGAPTLGR